jgi:hypothetical protein
VIHAAHLGSEEALRADELELAAGAGDKLGGVHALVAAIVVVE